MPLVMALCVVIGIVIGTFYANHFSGNRLNIINSGSSRLNNLLHIVDDQYVDTVNVNDLVEKAIPLILSELDPHSVYISAKNAKLEADNLKGSFCGVGIEFNIREDTIHVQNTVDNGPSERAGILPGDKIVTIDGKPFVGKVVTDEEAMARLKGEKGSKVKIGVMRYGSKKVHEFVVTRDEIKTKSISASYMLNDNTGYIKVKNFGETTYAELLVSLASLSQGGVKNLVIDLRDNTGGYLESAVQMANEFLSANRLIVYTEGRKSPRHDYRSDGRGAYQHIPLVVLINQNSASASEIFAGAMQDNDRATIIGRRSFGKGLVQQQIGFPDGAMMRLTIARYYTPAGRCIQKPYNKGDYENDIMQRYEHGEFFSQDSIKHTGPAFQTSNGRTVYGGGGITPDIFVSEDTLDMTSYYMAAAKSGLILQFAYNYTDENRSKLNAYKTVDDMESFLKKENMVEKFARFAETRGLQRRNLMIKKSNRLLETYIHSRVIYNILNEEALMNYLNRTDDCVLKASEIFQKGEAFPKATPAPKGKK